MRIDSATDDTIRVSLTVAIRFTDASVNRYTPIGYNLIPRVNIVSNPKTYILKFDVGCVFM